MAQQITQGTTSGTTHVVVVPSAGTAAPRRLQSLWIYNADSATVVANLHINDGTTTRQIAEESLTAGSYWVVTEPLYLKGTWQLEIDLDGAPSVTQPNWFVAWI